VLGELEQLLVLQDRDQKIKQLQTELKTLPQQRQALDAQLADTAAALDALKQKGMHLEVERKKLELDAATRSGTIARLKTQQYETRKNDEFQAISHEIERYEKDIRQIEDQELELMDQAEKLKEVIAAEDKKAAAGRGSVARQIADLDEKGKALEGRLQEITAERSQLASAIDEEVISRYERLFASKGDAAIVPIEHEICSGCHMKVTTQTAVRAKAGKEIVSCEQCGRILYVAA
jgi:predicted  nucleic acid-binding Zn-ribbon protein